MLLRFVLRSVLAVNVIPILSDAFLTYSVSKLDDGQRFFGNTDEWTNEITVGEKSYGNAVFAAM